MAGLATFLLSAVLLANVGLLGASPGQPFRSIKAPAETISNYRLVRPVIVHPENSEEKVQFVVWQSLNEETAKVLALSDKRTADYPKELTVQISGNDHSDFTLQLLMNEQFISPYFTSRHYDDDGKEVITEGHMNCFYHGEVQGHPDWKVSISTCHGLQGSFGDVTDKTSYYHIEPLDHSDSSLESPHALYLATELQSRERNCGSVDHVQNTLTSPLEGISKNTDTTERLRRQSSLIVELLMVNDNSQYQQFSSDLSMTVMRSLELANFADMLFKDLGIRVVLVELITWTNTDLITITTDANNLLDNFEVWENDQQNLAAHDTTMLLTSIDLDGGTVGIAFTGTMCESRSSVGLTQDRGASTDFVGSTVAHEMGHIFDMGHDDGRGCTCDDPTGDCIMAASSGIPAPVQWSSCSESDLQNGFTTKSLDRCLDNEPTQTVGDPVCGNGIREGDEVCDCGSAQECTDPCCNPDTCELSTGSQCSAGPCCNSTCQFKLYGTPCRDAIDECDIYEYCSGDSSSCPVDAHFQDGIECKSGQAYCYSGFCRTYDQQCQAAFGSNKASDDCYNLFNVDGDATGNCGYDNADYIPCPESDVQCGQLQCMSGDFQLDLPFTVTIGTGTISHGDGTTTICRSYTSQPGSDFESPGLVEDGTKCADGRYCFGHQCLPISSLPVISCPTGNNGLDCSGNGICNSLGQCSCNLGFIGSTCETAMEVPTGVTEPSTTTPMGTTGGMTGGTGGTTSGGDQVGPIKIAIFGITLWALALTTVL